tara:strand:- start:226 stop:621 length:396 start_codon:yes stop_codon:yes gene_type:complete
MVTEEEKNFLTVAEVAKMWGVCHESIYRDLAKGTLNGMKLSRNGGGLQWYIDRESVPPTRPEPEKGFNYYCAVCNTKLGVGLSLTVTNIYTNDDGVRLIAGMSGKYCSDDCLYKSRSQSKRWWQKLGVLNG